MAQQCAGTVGLHPHVKGEVLVGKVDAGFGSGCLCCILQFQCRLMIYSGAVQHTRHAEVLVFRQLTAEDSLIEEHAQLITCLQNAVGRLRLTQRFGTAHILNDEDLLTGSCHNIITVFAGREGTELIGPVGEYSRVSHVEVQVDNTAGGQHLLNPGIHDITIFHHIAAGIVPGRLTHALILYGNIFQTLVGRIVVAH